MERQMDSGKDCKGLHSSQGPLEESGVSGHKDHGVNGVLEGKRVGWPSLRKTCKA